jgi:DNA mismatch endonuclease (patch repair protein)
LRVPPMTRRRARSSSASIVAPDPRRSAVMRAIGARGTAPERAVRALVRELGYSASYNLRSLPGEPDVVVRSTHKAIFVHGCFWHGHSCRRGNRVPITNRAYWVHKIRANRGRHRAAVRELRRMGWSVLTVWECQLRQGARLTTRLRRFLQLVSVSRRALPSEGEPE